MAFGTARAAATACLGLIALQAAASQGGSGRIASLMNDVNGVLLHALDPKLPAIPDLRNGGKWAGSGGPALPAAYTPY